jgi:drug/metabolite transporter (DMT)-like permease
MIKLIAGLLLIILGIVMIALGMRAGILPPSVTGLGFFVIAAVFLGDGIAARSGNKSD